MQGGCNTKEPGQPKNNKHVQGTAFFFLRENKQGTALKILVSTIKGPYHEIYEGKQQ